MLKIWLPGRLYQLLPLAYLLAGLLMLAEFGDEPLGFLSGGMLCTAAILVLVLRVLGARRTPARRR